MDILELIAVLSFGLTCFGIGYSIGRDSNNTQKQPPRSSKLSGYLCFSKLGQPLLSAAPFYFMYSIVHKFN